MCNDPIYLLFAGQNYYPDGGRHDFQSYHRSIEEAVEAAKINRKYDWWHVVDHSNMKIVEEGFD